MGTASFEIGRWLILEMHVFTFGALQSSTARTYDVWLRAHSYHDLCSQQVCSNFLLSQQLLHLMCSCMRVSVKGYKGPNNPQPSPHPLLFQSSYRPSLELQARNALLHYVALLRHGSHSCACSPQSGPWLLWSSQQWYAMLLWLLSENYSMLVQMTTASPTNFSSNRSWIARQEWIINWYVTSPTSREIAHSNHSIDHDENVIVPDAIPAVM